MTRNIPKLLALAGLAATAFIAAPDSAKAADYCREYTRTVYIGNRAQDAYGTACLQPDGSWMIVGEGLGNDIPNNVSNVNYIIHDNRRDFTPQRVVYYDRRPVYYRQQPNPVFVWNINGHSRNGHYYKYNRYDRYDRYDRHDRHDHRGRGRGHDRWRD